MRTTTSPPSAQKHPPRTVAKMVHAYGRGYSVATVADQFGVKPDAARRILRNAGVQFRPACKPLPPTPDGFVKDYEELASIKKTGLKHKMNYGTARAILLRENVTLNPGTVKAPRNPPGHARLAEQLRKLYDASPYENLFQLSNAMGGIARPTLRGAFSGHTLPQWPTMERLLFFFGEDPELWRSRWEKAKRTT